MTATAGVVPAAVDETEFDRTTEPSVDAASPGRFTADLDPVWMSLAGIHGGSMAAIVVRAAQDVVPDRAVRTLSTSFLRAARPGPVEGTIDVVRSGRSVTIVHAELYQAARLLSTTRLTLTRSLGGAEWDAPISHDVAPLDECVAVQPPSGVHHLGRAAAMLDPRHEPFSHGDRARIQGWIRPLHTRPIDAAWLAMAVDWFPPAAFTRVDPPTGGVSVDLTTHVHRTVPSLGPGEWLLGSFELATSVAGLGLEHGWIATADGRLLAESFHTRWTA